MHKFFKHIKRSLIWTLLGPTLVFSATLSGYVVDAESGETIIGVNVIAQGRDMGASSDVNGFFIIYGLRADTVTIRFSHIGYE